MFQYNKIKNFNIKFSFLHDIINFLSKYWKIWRNVKNTESEINAVCYFHWFIDAIIGVKGEGGGGEGMKYKSRKRYGNIIV